MLNSLVTTVATPTKCPGRNCPHRMVDRPGTSTRVLALTARRHLRDAGREHQRDPFRRQRGVVLLGRARVGREVLLGPNCSGLTKMLTTTASAP